jgi:hypothetical protein
MTRTLYRSGRWAALLPPVEVDAARYRPAADQPTHPDPGSDTDDARPLVGV